MTKTLEEILTGVILCDGQGYNKKCMFLERGKDGKPKKGKDGKTKRTLDPSELKNKHDGEYKDEKDNSVGLKESDVEDRYHVYSTGNMKPDFMFIMETPGKKESYKKKNNENEFDKYVSNGKLINHDNLEGYAKLRQKNFLKWILKPSDKDNIKDNIIGIVNQELLDNQITLNLKDRQPEKKTFEFFDYVHVTDVRKCADGKTSICFKKFLKKEIEILNPKLIFCFGGEAWNQIFKGYESVIRNEKCNDEKIKEIEKGGKITKISDVHGYLFKFKIKDDADSIYILPCIHFSGTARNSAPRNSYIDYFKKGLTEYRGK
ncbi:uracil DNA glycosylase superfamily protein [archaeon BMS3Abin16]|nr:uracil DNA glycosylase superfamily protein [archaeon BMS3Abin16]